MLGIFRQNLSAQFESCWLGLGGHQLFPLGRRRRVDSSFTQGRGSLSMQLSNTNKNSEAELRDERYGFHKGLAE